MNTSSLVGYIILALVIPSLVGYICDAFKLYVENKVAEMSETGQVRVQFRSMAEIIDGLEASPGVMQRWLRQRGVIVSAEEAIEQAKRHTPERADAARIISFQRIEGEMKRLGLHTIGVDCLITSEEARKAKLN